MKKLILLLMLIIIANLFYIKNFIYNQIGNHVYAGSGFVEALDYYNKVGDIVGKINQSNSLYKMGKYKLALSGYESVISILGTGDSVVFYNMGNASYRLSESEKDLKKKRELLLDSVDYYKKSLDIEYDDWTKDNLEFVLKKLENLDFQQNKQSNNSGNKQKQGGDDKQNSEQDSNQGSNKKDGDKQNSGKESQKGDSSDQNKDNDQNKGEQSAQANEVNQNNQDINNEQKQALEQYAKQLKQNQIQYGKYYNKKYQNASDMFDNFFSDPFFDNSAMNGSNGEPDR